MKLFFVDFNGKKFEVSMRDVPQVQSSKEDYDHEVVVKENRRLHVLSPHQVYCGDGDNEYGTLVQTVDQLQLPSPNLTEGDENLMKLVFSSVELADSAVFALNLVLELGQQLVIDRLVKVLKG